MLFWIWIIMIVASLFISVVDRYCDFEWVTMPLFVTGVVCGAIALVFLFNNINQDAQIRKIEVKYETLLYQLENDIYDNDNDLGKRELYVDVQNFNENLAWNKEAQYDFWIGIFIPNIYDEFDYINLEEFK